MLWDMSASKSTYLLKCVRKIFTTTKYKINKQLPAIKVHYNLFYGPCCYTWMAYRCTFTTFCCECITKERTNILSEYNIVRILKPAIKVVFIWNEIYWDLLLHQAINLYYFSQWMFWVFGTSQYFVEQVRHRKVLLCYLFAIYVEHCRVKLQQPTMHC